MTNTKSSARAKVVISLFSFSSRLLIRRAKLVGLINRHPDISVETFRDRWFSELGPEVSKIDNIIGYTQAPTRAGIYKTGRIPDYDGVANLWFKSDTSRHKTLTSKPMQTIQKMEINLIDFSRSKLFWVRPVTIMWRLASRMDMIKLTESVTSRIERAIEEGKTLTAAYVDTKGKPHISFYGSIHVHSQDTLALWVRKKRIRAFKDFTYETPHRVTVRRYIFNLFHAFRRYGLNRK